MSYGQFIVRHRWLVLGVWAALAVGLSILAGRGDAVAKEEPSFLPPDQPYSRAVAALGEAFPDSGGDSQAVVVFERPTGKLTEADLDFIEHFARRIPDPNERPADMPPLASDLARVRLRTPRDVPLPQNPLISANGSDGQAAIVIANLPTQFASLRAGRIVHHVRELLERTELPAGLRAAVTGSAAYGRDFGHAAKTSNDQSLRVMLVAVIVILILVYRAPLAALVPLGAIGLAAVVAMRLLDLCQHFGMFVGAGERIFSLVLLYGAGVDYSLLLVGRYREFLSTHPAGDAPALAMDRSARALIASAGTDICGMLMMSFAVFRVFRSTGPAIAIALVIALLAAITLVPAGLRVFGPRLFWPRRPNRPLGGDDRSSGRIWGGIALAVTRRPGLVLLLVAVVLALPVFQGLHVPWVYDTLADLGPEYGSIQGANMVKRHWPVGQIAPTTVLLQADRAVSPEQWEKLSEEVTPLLLRQQGVLQVRSLSSPLGTGRSSDPASAKSAAEQRVADLLTLGLSERLIRQGARKEYISPDGHAMRLSVVLTDAPLTLEAMDTLLRCRGVLDEAAGGYADAGLKVYLGGATAQMYNSKVVTTQDFHRIGALTLSAVFLLVLISLRQPLLTLVIVCGTLLSYLATLGISYWVFSLMGDPGLDWKVEVFLFMVMVAVGVDYSIFLTARIREEVRTRPSAQAVRHALIHTGPVISSCGVTMAASLGSLMAGHLSLLHQLGFAFAVGMLLDTFVSRPLVLPAAATLLYRLRRPR